MTRRAPLPKITECSNKRKRGNRISAARLAQAVYPFLVICALCLAHIHLEFQRADMLMQQSSLQSRQRQLVRDENYISRQNEFLCNPETLKFHARRDLNMQEFDNSSRRMVVSVPGDLRAKYLKPGTPDNNSVMVAQIREDRKQEGLQNRVLAFIDANRANASVLADGRN